MIRYVVFLVLIFNLSNSIAAQETEIRSLDPYTKVKVATGIKATLVEGTTNQIEIKTQNIELEEIMSSVRGGQLVVKLQTNLNLWKEGSVDVHTIITYTKELSSIIATTGASVYSDNTVSSEDIEIKSTTGASLDIATECGDIRALVTTGAKMNLHGIANRLDLRSNSGATFKGFNLVTQKARVKGGTGANAEINVAEYIKTNINTGAILEYKGSPTKKDIKKGTGGEVIQRG